MPKLVKPLTVTQIKNAKPKDKVYYLRDGRGLLLQVNPTGSKIWILDYVHPVTKKRTSHTIGHFPDVSLQEARETRDRLKKNIKQGVPIAQESSSMTFGQIARQYLKKLESEKSEGYFKKELSRYEKYLAKLENADVDRIDKNPFINIARSIQDAGYVEQGRRVFELARRILDYAVANGYVENNCLANLPTNLLLKRTKHKNYPHITNPYEFGQLLRTLDSYKGDLITKKALIFLSLTFVRPANIRNMEWKDVDFTRKLWIIPAEKMKMDNSHIVPLSKQALEILEEMSTFGWQPYVFPSPITLRSPMSENTLNYAIARIGYKGKMTSHGFRHTASTLLHENIHVHGIPSEVIELQMAHTDRNTIRATYNKAKFLDLRTKLMQWWADYLDELKNAVYI